MQLARCRLDDELGSAMVCKSLTKASADQPANREALIARIGTNQCQHQQGLFACWNKLFCKEGLLREMFAALTCERTATSSGRVPFRRPSRSEWATQCTGSESAF